MNRRNFLKNGSAAGLAVGALSIASCSPPAEKKTEEEKVPASESPFLKSFELDELTITQLQQMMQQNEYTARLIAETYLKRIDQIDRYGPRLRSVIEVNPDALHIADEMDKERKAGKIRGPLHGIPILIKDNIETGDQMMTTAGSIALDGNKASRDAFIIKKLRESGAVLLGKTNLSEWANFRSTRSSSGWSSRGGQTKNPFVLDRNPCGSSSGSGVAVAANLCAVAIGTETDGSIIAPSSFNGIVGIKPTVGLLSRSGIIPISKTQDTAGPMTRTVTDAAILLSALAGTDAADEATKAADEQKKDYTRFLDAAGLKGKKIGFQKYEKANEKVTALYKAAMETLKNQGAALEEVDLLKPVNEAGEAEFTVLKYEFKDGINKYLDKAGAKPKSLADLISFNKENADQIMPYFDQEIFEMCEEKGDLSSKEYLDSLKKSISSRSIIDGLMKKQSLDCIIGISVGPANCTDLVNGDYDTGFSFCGPAATAGYPHITVPMGTVQELPVGLSFMASAYAEPVLFTVAYAYEQASKKRKQPAFLKTATAF